MTEVTNKKYITKFSTRFIESAQNVLSIEIAAVEGLRPKLNANFEQACEFMLNCRGRIIVLGMGKSGHIARKIAATLASTGSPAFFVHPGEANHGDLGMVTQHDVLLAISYSGETAEIITLLPALKALQVPIIALCGKAQSTLAREANAFLDVGVKKEACPLNLAPTASTTATLVMGDALAIALLEARNFTKDDFARVHPGGSLGKRLIMRVSDIMRDGAQIPSVPTGTHIDEALFEITKKSLGMTLVVDDENKLLGVFTDGDLRRTLDQGLDVHTTAIDTIMTKNPITITPHILAYEALLIMEQHKITTLPVVHSTNEPLGVIHMHDLLRAGVIA